MAQSKRHLVAAAAVVTFPALVAACGTAESAQTEPQVLREVKAPQTMQVSLGSLLPSRNAPPSVGEIKIDETWTTAGNDSAAFGSIDGMAQTQDGSIWVSDGMASRVMAMRPREGWRVIARPGSGPGEVATPSLLARTETGGIAVYGIATAAVHRFDSAGRYERSVRLERMLENPKSFLITDNGEYVLSGGLASSGHVVHRFAVDGSLAGQWEALPASDDPRAGLMVAGGALAMGSDGSLVYSQAAPFRIARLVANERSVTVLREDSGKVPPAADDFIREVDGWREFDWDFTRSRAVHVLPDGRILNVIWNRKKNESTWEIYEGSTLAAHGTSWGYEPFAFLDDGEVLASYRVPETDEVIAVRLRVREL